MCGDYNSVLGMKKENAIARFLNKHKKNKLETADGKATLCGIIFEVDKKTKIVKDFKQIKIDGILEIKWQGIPNLKKYYASEKVL